MLAGLRNAFSEAERFKRQSQDRGRKGLGVALLTIFLGILPLPFNSALADPSRRAEAPNNVLSLDGDWSGVIALYPPTHVVLHIRTISGAARATWDNVDLGQLGFPVSSLRQQGDRVSFSLKGRKDRFQGVLFSDHKMLQGNWTEGEETQPLALARSEANSPLQVARARPPEPLSWRLPSDQTIREVLRTRVDVAHQGVGFVVSVVAPAGVRFVSYGTFNRHDPRSVGPRSVFEIDSVTKVFTGLLLADMVRRGEVGLHGPVARYLPPSVKVPEWRRRRIILLDLATPDVGPSA